MNKPILSSTYILITIIVLLFIACAWTIPQIVPGVWAQKGDTSNQMRTSDNASSAVATAMVDQSSAPPNDFPYQATNVQQSKSVVANETTPSSDETSIDTGSSGQNIQTWNQSCGTTIANVYPTPEPSSAPQQVESSTLTQGDPTGNVVSSTQSTTAQSSGNQNTVASNSINIVETNGAVSVTSSPTDVNDCLPPIVPQYVKSTITST
jgi:hypothetical protein